MTVIKRNHVSMKEFRSQKYIEIKTDEDILQAMAYTDQLAGNLGFLPVDQLLLCLVTEEALVNAREYSVKDGQNQVGIYWHILDNELIISVKQPGGLFKITKNEEMNYGLHGRGLQLILTIMDEVWLEEEAINQISLCMKKVVK